MAKTNRVVVVTGAAQEFREAHFRKCWWSGYNVALSDIRPCRNDEGPLRRTAWT